MKSENTLCCINEHISPIRAKSSCFKTENFDLNSKNVKGCTLFHNAFIHEQEVVVNTTTHKNPLAKKLKKLEYLRPQFGPRQPGWVMGRQGGSWVA